MADKLTSTQSVDRTRKTTYAAKEVAEIITCGADSDLQSVDKSENNDDLAHAGDISALKSEVGLDPDKSLNDITSTGNCKNESTAAPGVL